MYQILMPARRAGLPVLLCSAAFSVALAAAEPPFVGSKQISATQLARAVLARNPSLPAMQAAREAAEARIVQASALDDPMFSYTFAPATVGVSDLDFSQSFEISQALPWPGKRRMRGEAAQHEAKAAHEGIDSQRLKLIALAKSAFADWYFIHEAIRINRVNQDLLQEFRHITETRYGTGLASKQDALQADVELNMLTHQAILLERERREVLAAINKLVNRAPDQALPAPAPLPAPVAPPDAAALRARAINAQPELKILAARIQSARARTDLAGREFYPDLELVTGYDSFWDREEQRFTVGVGINIPLDRTKRRAAADEYRALMKQAEWELAEKRSALAGEVQRAYDRVQETLQLLALHRERLLPIAAENLEAAKADYAAGQGVFLALVTAEKNVMQTELGERQSLADYHRRLAELERLVGGPLDEVKP
ncbi:MAG: TolC family protein [Gammaproteobacteria bacterium]